MRTSALGKDITPVIFCGGKNPKEFGDKPKYFYHINGKQRLISVFESLRAIGIESSNVRLLLGDFEEYTRKVLKEKCLYPEIVVNRQNEMSAVFSYKIAFEGLDKQKGSVLLLLGDEYYAPEVLQQIVAAKGDLICFARPQIGNYISPPALNIIRCSTDLIKYFTDDIYLNSNFYSADQKVFQTYYSYSGNLKPPEKLPCEIHTGYALGFMQLDAIGRVVKDFPKRCVFLPDHGLYIPDLDTILQTDEYKNTMLPIRIWIREMRSIRARIRQIYFKFTGRVL